MCQNKTQNNLRSAHRSAIAYAQSSKDTAYNCRMETTISVERIVPCEFECGAVATSRVVFPDGAAYACDAHVKMLLLSSPPETSGGASLDGYCAICYHPLDACRHCDSIDKKA